MRLVGIQLKPSSLTQRYVGLLFSICTLALVAGCEQGESPSETGQTGGEPVVAETVKDTKVTSAEAEQFAKEYLSAIDKQDLKKIQQLVYWDALVDRIFSGLSPDDDFYREYSNGGKKILGRFAKGIQIETGGKGNYAYLKTVRRGKDRHVIFRLVTGSSAASGGGRINYHNLRLIKIDGEVRADDIYVARMGSWFSESYRNALQPVLLNSQKSSVGFTSVQREEMEGYRLTAEMINAANSGQQSEASRLYQELPEEIKKKKTVMVARLLATERDEFFKAVEAMNSEFPSSPAVGLSLMDFGMLQQDLPTLKRARESLEKWTTGDPYIDLNIAASMLKQGDVEEAVELSREIDVKDFNFRYPVFLKFNIALQSKDNATLLKCFRIFRDDYDDNIKEILKTDALQSFTESLEYVDLKND